MCGWIQGRAKQVCYSNTEKAKRNRLPWPHVSICGSDLLSSRFRHPCPVHQAGPSSTRPHTPSSVWVSISAASAFAYSCCSGLGFLYVSILEPYCYIGKLTMIQKRYRASWHWCPRAPRHRRFPASRPDAPRRPGGSSSPRS